MMTPHPLTVPINIVYAVTRSREEVLLSVLNIDQKDIDAKQLEECGQSAFTKYTTMTAEEKKAAKLGAKRGSRSLSRTMSQSLIIESHSNQLMNNAHFLRYVDDENSMSPSTDTISSDLAVPFESLIANNVNDRENVVETSKARDGPLADPYDEEWNGLDPDNYFWDDDLPEGDCYDDEEFSLRDRRTQYLVVMAIENQYCSISDLTYEQNELLLMYQDSMVI